MFHTFFYTKITFTVAVLAQARECMCVFRQDAYESTTI